MSAPPAAGRDRDAPRLAPRPLWRPPVDPAQAAAFGRPRGPSGSIPSVPVSAPSAAGSPPPVVAPEVADAFSPQGAEDAGLQRPPDPGAEPDAATSDGDDPWRDPHAQVRLGPPAEQEPAVVVVPPPPAERWSLREALFQRRLRPSALVGLLTLCLVIGVAGAAIGGWVTGRLPSAVADPQFQLATGQPAVERAPGSIAAVAARVVPAVVSIEIRSGDSGDTGSGVVIDGKGYIVTNNHVVSLAATDKAAVMTVVFNDGAHSRVPATVVGRDPETDLAVVKVDRVAGATVAQLGSSASLRVGDPVIAIGSPLGLAGTVTTGIVSALDRPVRLQGGDSDTNAVIDAVQTDAAVNPGNSGGALVDATGTVVGINTAIRTLGGDGSGSIGLGFAIPIDTARAVAEELIRTGTVVHSTIGVNARSATDGTTDGAQVQNVADGGPAAKAGIREGDVITRIGDRAVGDADSLVVAVQSLPVGRTVPVTLTRSGRTLTVQVTLAAE
ncbi:S1C family serine protease [Nakamurella endophytica]|uniref:Serine protease n=1 Tax=Nakamurella endophytica TaxID=1748367 RepID=A0A917STZ7_9ACTN|nr:trypsin-like peptidase domain-containing protein [Nakamurella endophytica]GGL95775.1 serine protease [Nakamurella endophytica]